MTIQRNEKMSSTKTPRTGKKQRYSAMDIQTMVHLAAKSIAPVWPLKTFIACNSLQGFESKPFEEALHEAQCLFEQSGNEYQDINQETIKWCGAYFDKGQSVIEIPTSNTGFYATFKDLSQYDKKLHQGSTQNKQWLRQLPNHAEEAIALCLDLLKISDEEQVFFLKKSLAQLPGWSGYIKWLTEWQNTPNHLGKPSNMLVDFIAIRLIITVLLNPKINLSENVVNSTKSHKHPMIDRIKKLEENYQSHLVRPLLSKANAMNTLQETSPDVQLVFCIDVRSEPFRRHLESLGNYETLGFAGFFGLPIRLHDYNSGKITDSCPVLLKPRYDIHDCPSDNACSKKQHEQGKTLLNGLTDMYQELKYNFATPFALVETLGAWCGLLMLSKTMKPSLTLSIIKKLTDKIRPTVATNPMVDMTAADSSNGISSTDQALYAEAVLRIMGLTENFGKFVIFCGHGSSTQNNPYASGLDCGACGGNHGGGNAKALAAILNKESIQATLSERGIFIPEDTRFLAAEHNTTTDDVIIFEDNERRLLHKETLKLLKYNLKEAKTKNTASRVIHFDVSTRAKPVEETDRRSQDWSEVRPEWGLARNAAFIIGPRRLTKALDLEGRCFLHSYDWIKDEQLTSLETILTAPMVVAEWINTQYLFSTIDNVTYGSGSKVTHNVTGKIGVMQGNGSDLMHGLPLQSVNATDGINYHQPQRLLTIIYAPRENVTAIINRQDILKKLFFNAWVHLIVIEPTENKAYQLQTTGEWYLLTNKGEKNEFH
ncbi:MAG: DUF2309 domain-containing protein [Legionellales bacterium]|nr:DUF2309 domain-containing protein [Legionellales bacterium]